MGQARRRAQALAERLQATDRTALVEVSDDSRASLAGFLDAVSEDLREMYALVSSAHFVQPAALQPLDPTTLLEAG